MLRIKMCGTAGELGKTWHCSLWKAPMRRGLSREFLGQISDLGTLPVLKWQMGMSQNGDIYIIYIIYI